MNIEDIASISHLNAVLRSAQCVVGKCGGVRIRCSLPGRDKSVWTTRNRLTKIAVQLLREPTVIEYRYTACAEVYEQLKALQAFRVEDKSFLTRIRQFFGNLRYKREVDLDFIETKLASNSPEEQLEALKKNPADSGIKYLKVVNGFLSRNLPDRALEAASLIPEQRYLGFAIAAYKEIAHSYEERGDQVKTQRVMRLLRTSTPYHLS